MIVFLLALLLLIPKPVLSQDASELQNKIDQYSQKLTELKKSKDTLSNQINILNSQIDLTLLKISQTENTIKVLEAEIAELTIKISDLDVTLNELSSVYIQQINQNYKLQKRLPQFLIFLTNSFNHGLEQYKYLTTIQKNSQNTLVNLETVRTNYDNEKEKKRIKQSELEVLQKNLASQKDSLAKQKQSKAYLLEVTKNDEKNYQQLKKAAEEELRALLNAKFVGKREVKKGEALGLMGNTGYSFGAHLHFGLYDLPESKLASWSYQNDIDPSGYISANRWPMGGTIRITQERGVTFFSKNYSDNFHHGIDMVSDNTTIVAVNDGVAYFYRNAGSSLGNHVKLFHPDGKMTLYLHMQ